MKLVIVIELNEVAGKQPMLAAKLGRRMAQETNILLAQWQTKKHYPPADLAKNGSAKYELDGIEVPTWATKGGRQ